MYALIGAKVATRMELEEYWTLDDALKLFALWRMSQDIEAAHADEIRRRAGGGRRQV